MLLIYHELVFCSRVRANEAKFPEAVNEIPMLTPPLLAHVEAPY